MLPVRVGRDLEVQVVGRRIADGGYGLMMVGGGRAGQSQHVLRMPVVARGRAAAVTRERLRRDDHGRGRGGRRQGRRQSRPAVRGETESRYSLCALCRLYGVVVGSKCRELKLFF